LQNGKLTRFNGTRERALDIEAFAARIADAQSTPDAQSSIADAQSTRTCCAIYATPDAQSSAVLAPIPPEDCALPTDRPTPSIPIQTGTDGGKEVLSQKPFATQKAQPTDSESESAMGDEEPTEEEQAAAEAAAEKSFAEFQWQQLMAGIPDVLQGALMLHGQRAEIEKLVAKHGPDRLLASIARWIDYRELPIEGRKTNKWGALLEEIAPHIAQVRKDDRQKRRRQNR